MKKNETYLDKAEENLIVAKNIFNSLKYDDVFLNFTGYHLQQAVELSVKYLLERNGVNYPKTHDISQLIILGKENNVDLYLTPYMEEHSDTFTIWESKTRYVLNYKVEERKIKTALDEVEKYLETIKENVYAEDKSTTNQVEQKSVNFTQEDENSEMFLQSNFDNLNQNNIANEDDEEDEL